jgi:hypothetical protein
MIRSIKRESIIKQLLLRIAMKSTQLVLLQMIATTNIITGRSTIIIMKTTTIIESMKEREVYIDIITEDPLLHLKEEEEKEVVTDTMISIIGQEIITNKNTLKMSTASVEEKKIPERVVIIIIENILAHFLIPDHGPGSLNLIKSIIMSLEEKK